MFINRIELLGNLTRDPEFKWLDSGVAVTQFGLATNRSWKNKDGERQEEAEFHAIVIYGRQAQPCADYLVKGQEALVLGRIHTRSWDGEDGLKRYRTEVIAEQVQFGKRPAGSDDAADNDIDAEQAETDAEQDTVVAEADTDDDIPF